MKLGETGCVIAATVQSKYKEEPEIWYLSKEFNNQGKYYYWAAELTDALTFNSESNAITFYNDKYSFFYFVNYYNFT